MPPHQLFNPHLRELCSSFSNYDTTCLLRGKNENSAQVAQKTNGGCKDEGGGGGIGYSAWAQKQAPTMQERRMGSAGQAQTLVSLARQSQAFRPLKNG